MTVVGYRDVNSINAGVVQQLAKIREYGCARHLAKVGGCVCSRVGDGNHLDPSESLQLRHVYLCDASRTDQA
jgi:hypothetical protein